MRTSRRAFGTLAAVMLWALTGSESHAATAEEALRGCENHPDSAAPRLCEAYMTDIMMFLGSDDRMMNPKGRLCLDEALEPTEVIPLVIEWIKAHPGQRSISVFEAAHNALSPQYRCN